MRLCHTKKKWIGLPLLLFSSSFAFAADKMTASQTAQSRAFHSQTKVHLDLSLGFGQFSDLVIQEDDPENIEIQGKAPSSKESSLYSGLPISVQIGLQRNRERIALSTNLSVLTMNNSSMNRGQGQRSASYSNLEIGAGFGYLLWSGVSFRPTIQAFGALKRSIFSNVSKSHYLDAFMLRAGGGFGLWSRWHVNAYYGTSIWSQFGYNHGSNFSNQAIPGSQAQISDLSGILSYQVESNASIGLGVKEETSRVHITDLREYSSLGLNVPYLEQTPRDYLLQARSVQVSFSRKW